MKKFGIARICCLLNEEQLGYYQAKPGLIDFYREEFGLAKVLHAPVEDYHLIDRTELETRVLPFLWEAVKANEKVLVHCSGGYGRTGHVLAAWLVHGRGYTPGDSLKTVIEMGRNPYEAVQAGNATEEELFILFE